MSERSAHLADGAGRRLATFFGVLTALVIAFSVGSWARSLDILAVGPIYMFTPLVAAVVVCHREGVSLRDIGLRLGDKRWIVISALIWPPMALLIAVLSMAVPGISFDPSIITAETGVPDNPVWLLVGFIGLVAFMVVVGMTVNAVFAFGEEFGWRGYLLWELAPFGFWKASVLIGLVWGLWHVPLVLAGLNYPSFPIVGVILFTVVCVLLSPIYTYVVVNGGSVLPAAVLHGVFNAVGLVALARTDSPVRRELVASEGGVIGIAVFAIILLVLWRLGTPAIEQPFSADPRDTSSRRPIDRTVVPRE